MLLRDHIPYFTIPSVSMPLNAVKCLYTQLIMYTYIANEYRYAACS